VKAASFQREIEDLLGVINGCESGESTKKINGKITCAKFLRIGRVRKKLPRTMHRLMWSFF